MKLPVGASPRFSSAHLRLNSHVLNRATFCFPDSHMGPRDFETTDRMGLLERLDSFRSLSDYVEAHVHGSLEIEATVDAVVLDPSHKGTEVDDAAHKLGCPVE